MCCKKSNNVHCFGAIFLNQKFCICILLRRPSGPCATQRIEKLPNYQTPRMSLGWSWWGAFNTSTVTVNTRNDMISIHQRSARTNERKITLILSDCVMSDFIMSDIMFLTSTPLDNSPHHLTSRRFHSLVPWLRPRRIRAPRTRLSLSENSAP